MNGAQKCFNVTIIDDTVVEPNQSISIILTTYDDHVNVQNGLLVVEIIDNDSK